MRLPSAGEPIEFIRADRTLFCFVFEELNLTVPGFASNHRQKGG
jgi:hypothetical protein